MLLERHMVPVERRRVSGASMGVDEEGPAGPCCGLPVALINPGSVPDDSLGDHKRMLAR